MNELLDAGDGFDRVILWLITKLHALIEILEVISKTGRFMKICHFVDRAYRQHIDKAAYFFIRVRLIS